MASSYTSRIRLEKQGDGENANTWGLRLNENTIDIVDEAVAGYETISVDGLTSATLTANNGTADQSRNMALRFTGALTADCTVVAPASEKVYFVNNETTGDKNIVLKSGTTSETIYPSTPALVAFDGTNSVKLDGFAPETSMLFYQATAPIGWTKQSINDKALRVVSGSGGSTAGTTAFSSVFAARTPAGTMSGSTAGHAITQGQLPSHFHYQFVNNASGSGTVGASTFSAVKTAGGGFDNEYDIQRPTSAASATDPNVGRSKSIGDNEEHTHGAGTLAFTGTAMDFDVQYADVIICTKDY